MKILIIEDEPFAADHLEILTKQLRPDWEVLAKLPTIQETVSWLNLGQTYDVIFTDIQLADGICFEIFQQVQIDRPIIFTTAYDQYAIKAFKLNSIDYLLKPIDKPSLTSAFEKLEKLQVSTAPAQPQGFSTDQLQQLLQSLQPSYKQRFAIKIGDNIRLVPTEEILFFQSQHKMTYLTTEAGKRYPVQYTLAELEGLIDQKQFFRINRGVLLRDRAIKGVAMISNSRLKVKVPFVEEDFVVSRERCQDFKEWLDR
ncbi:MAG: response regulator transcription factor [Saprospiraceae bacterium]|nr:response regulator transcription factor [Saprospiraceae bacterium]